MSGRAPADRPLAVLALLALAALLFAGASQSRFVDPDLWHEMALARELFARGELPREDVFAYTPTVSPSVHHEWGTGVILYLVATRAGAAGLLALEYLLVFAIGAACLWCARRRGASWPVLWALGPLAVAMLWTGVSTVRAQMFTLLATALTLRCLDRDRAGDRRWIPFWLALWLFWLNLHGGSAAGAVLFALHALEQGLRRRPVGHLALCGAAMLALSLVNPYGAGYLLYLGRALAMPRPTITEWGALWQAFPPLLFLWGLSVLLCGYAALRLGPRRLEGLPLVVATAAAALLHQRHLSLHAVAWAAYAPAWIAPTPLGLWLGELWVRRRGAVRAASAVVALACAGATAARDPFRLELPSRPGEHPTLVYPVGAVDYLRESGFRGNLMVTFTAGAYVMWKLGPGVQVSMDGRYEVAYPPGALAENEAFFAAGEGWRATLERYPTDAVLAPLGAPIGAELGRLGWTRAYRDDAFEVHARPGLALEPLERRGAPTAGSFP